MANEVGTHVIVVDTAAATPIVTYNVLIIGLFWYNPTAAGNEVVLNDGNGNEIWADIVNEIGTANNVLIQTRRQARFSKAIPAAGLIVPTLASNSKLFIYLSN